MASKAIYFDMDGTIADLYGVADWLPKLMAKDVTPYQDAKPLGNLKVLNDKLAMLADRGYTIGVVSWCAKNNPNDEAANKRYDNAVRKAKREWLRTHLPVATKIHVVKHGTDKSKAAKVVAKNMVKCVLFDDEQPNCQAWERKQNHEAVHVTKFADIVAWVDKELDRVCA